MYKYRVEVCYDTGTNKLKWVLLGYSTTLVGAKETAEWARGMGYNTEYDKIRIVKYSAKGDEHYEAV